MKEALRELVRGAPGPWGRNLAREFLQAQVLAGLQRCGAMVQLAFQGGTALRFLYAMPRHSEDLDFTLERPGPSYDVRRWLESVRADLRREAYPVELRRVSDQRTVHGGFVSFPGLLQELGLSGQRAEALAVKVEIGTRPPRGAVLETTVVRRHALLRLQHHDRASLLAGKLHAILQRRYAKGRDFYDLVWYLSDRSWPAPNLRLLNNALRQTGWTHAPLDESGWVAAVRKRVEALDWKALAADVQPLLERAEDRELLTRATLLGLLEARQRGGDL